MNPIITERRVLSMFYEGLMQSTGMSWITPIATAPFDSDQDSEEYVWLGQTPQMTEKGGQKKFDQLRSESWVVNNVEYQNGLRVPEKHILYDKTGQVMVRITDLAERVQAHWATLIGPLIVNGESTVCYDDQYFFDTDHSEGDSGNQSNDLSADISTYPVSVSGTTTQPSSGEMVFAIMDSIKQIVSFKDDKGEYVNENMSEFLVLTGMPLMTNALSALRNTSIDGGNGNLLIEQDSYRIRIASSPRFDSWTTKFATFATQGMQKPIIRQQRRPNAASGSYDVQGIAVETLWLDSEYCKLNDECLFSVETERAVAYGDWKKACLTTLV